MFSAFVTPVMIYITGIAVPLGLLSADALAYDQILAMARNPVGKIALFLVVFLPLWHAAHRLRMTLHDLGIPSAGVVLFACYGTAALGSIAAAVSLLRI